MLFINRAYETSIGIEDTGMCIEKRTAEDGVGVVPESGSVFLLYAPAMKALRLALDEFRVRRSEDSDHLGQMLGSVVRPIFAGRCGEEITTTAEGPYLHFELVETLLPAVFPL